MRFAALMLVSGCGFSITAGGNAPDDAALDDAELVDLAADMPIDIMLPDDDDDDDDTVVDTQDNCPLVTNTDQHDEDLDARGDSCDPCPQISGANADTDGDGIGDACDPRPTMAGDVLVRFDGFALASSSVPTPWAAIGGFPGDWGTSGDALRLDTNDTAHLLRIDAGGENTMIDFELDASLPGQNVPSVSAIVNGDTGLTSFTACSILHTEQSRRLQTFANGAFSSLASAGSIVMVPGTHRLVARLDDTATRCTFVPGGVLSNFVEPERRFVGLRVRNLRVAIKYIAVYRSP